jgi:hypothetical protein
MRIQPVELDGNHDTARHDSFTLSRSSLRSRRYQAGGRHAVDARDLARWNMEVAGGRARGGAK